MSNLMRKLKSRKGETLVESLASILIFTMASIVLYSLVTTAGHINGEAKKKDQQIQTQMVAVERGDPASLTGSGQVTMTLDGSEVEIAKVKVDIYGGQNNSLFAYFVHPDGGT